MPLQIHGISSAYSISPGAKYNYRACGSGRFSGSKHFQPLPTLKIYQGIPLVHNNSSTRRRLFTTYELYHLGDLGLLGLQSRSGDKLLKVQVVCLRNGTAVLPVHTLLRYFESLSALGVKRGAR